MGNAELDVQTAGAIAYEDLFVPALMGQWAPQVADAAGIAPGDRVLDVACGTGVLAREALARVGPTGFVAGLDPAPGMLAVARRLAPQVAYREGLAESLPYPERSFDVVTCQFGLMFFSDRPRALREMVRVLAPGGRLALAVWDALERSPGFAAEVALVERLAGRRAADALRAPFALGDPADVAVLLQNAGADSVTVTTSPGVARFPSIRTLIEADLRGWLPLVGVVLDERQIEQVLAQAETALAPYRTAEGMVVFEVPAHIASGTKRLES